MHRVVHSWFLNSKSKIIDVRSLPLLIMKHKIIDATSLPLLIISIRLVVPLLKHWYLSIGLHKVPSKHTN